MDLSLEKRFWPKVKKTEGCWLWTAATDKHGYGVLSYGPKRGKTQPYKRAIQVAHYLKTGDWPPPGYGVHHTCDVPACVRPEHLWLGTQAENLRDMVAKGRHVGARRLCVAQVIEIRARRLAGESYDAIAPNYGVARETVRAICERKRWAHV